MEPVNFVHELHGVFEDCWVSGLAAAGSGRSGLVEFEDVNSEKGHAGSGGTVVAEEGFEVIGYGFDEQEWEVLKGVFLPWGPRQPPTNP